MLHQTRTKNALILLNLPQNKRNGPLIHPLHHSNVFMGSGTLEAHSMATRWVGRRRSQCLAGKTRHTITKFSISINTHGEIDLPPSCRRYCRPASPSCREGMSMWPERRPNASPRRERRRQRRRGRGRRR
jgi:hypothetical protein